MEEEPFESRFMQWSELLVNKHAKPKPTTPKMYEHFFYFIYNASWKYDPKNEVYDKIVFWGDFQSVNICTV